MNSFINGKGQITITESGKAGKPLLQVTIPLTPGPLVVAGSCTRGIILLAVGCPVLWVVYCQSSATPWQ
eukprot:COSAG05_NODE_4475_length_1498_cov_1.420300_2_plen_68_part_01